MNQKLFFGILLFATLALTLTSKAFNTTKESNDTLMRKLSVDGTFYATLKVLYNKYGKEIADFRPKMRTWCEESKSCKYTDFEAEMLYMLVREYKPHRVFEMAPNRGYSTHWILHALHKNDKRSRLHSIDIHDASLKLMNEEYKRRWDFTLGDYAVLYDEGKIDMEQYDFIFIDALHEEEFARGYCKRLFSTRKKKAVVAIHDIVADENGGGRESAEVYKYMALANNVHNVFTMSPFAMPNMLYNTRAPEIVPKLNKMRANLGIVKDCTEDSCGSPLHDPLYFKNGYAPTIFFEIN